MVKRTKIVSRSEKMRIIIFIALFIRLTFSSDAEDFEIRSEQCRLVKDLFEKYKCKFISILGIEKLTNESGHFYCTKLHWWTIFDFKAVGNYYIFENLC